MIGFFFVFFVVVVVVGGVRLQQPQIILLKEGTDTSQGKAQLVSNINACVVVADTVRSTLGPRGMDKLIHDDKGGTTISNDGATIMKLLDIVHPAASILVDIAKSQDSEVCTFSCPFCGERCRLFYILMFFFKKKNGLCRLVMERQL